VLKDKIVGCRTVVNKTQTIDNTYRNFQMELLCGEADYQVTVKENGVTYEFDFSSVYWNPRLSMEHERVVKMLRPGDYLFDCFAGVGPFSVPAAKRKCKVWANDLNPESYKWLQHNARKNKVLANLETFNKDGRAFIVEDLKTQLIRLIQNSETETKQVHITMNLPAMATEFLGAFVGLFSGEDVTLGKCLPLVHVYCFAKGETNHKEIAQQLAETHMGMKFTGNLKEITFVRNVAPNKEMMRISFYLNEEILFGKATKRPADDNDVDTTAKRQCKHF
jgi:tRNA (guanine37-N1)-methyltransferase